MYTYAAVGAPGTGGASLCRPPARGATLEPTPRRY